MFSGLLYPATSNDHKKNLTKWNLLCLTRWNQTPTNRGKTATTQKLTHTCSYITNILKAQKSPVSVTLPYFSSFVLSGAPLVIDTNWKKGILDGHSMDAPSLAILLRDCPLPLKTNPTFHRRKNIFWSIYLLQNFWHPWKSSPWKCLYICNIINFWSIFS